MSPKLTGSIGMLPGKGPTCATTPVRRQQADLSSHEIYAKLDIVEWDEDGQIAKYGITKAILNKVGEAFRHSNHTVRK